MSVEQVNALNEVLLRIVGVMSLQYCRALHAEGMDRDAINARLAAHIIPGLEQWRADTLTAIVQLHDKPQAPPDVTVH